MSFSFLYYNQFILHTEHSIQLSIFIRSSDLLFIDRFNAFLLLFLRLQIIGLLLHNQIIFDTIVFSPGHELGFTFPDLSSHQTFREIIFDYRILKVKSIRNFVTDLEFLLSDNIKTIQGGIVHEFVPVVVGNLRSSTN